MLVASNSTHEANDKHIKAIVNSLSYQPINLQHGKYKGAGKSFEESIRRD
jgi:hypothetical protein